MKSETEKKVESVIKKMIQSEKLLFEILRDEKKELIKNDRKLS